MNTERIVASLLENDAQGPPAPDKFLDAVGSTRDLRAKHRQMAKALVQLDSSLQIERQLRQAGVTRDEVARYIRADYQYPSSYGFGKRKGALPPDALVGMYLNDGRKVMFDLAVVPER